MLRLPEFSGAVSLFENVKDLIFYRALKAYKWYHDNACPRSLELVIEPDLENDECAGFTAGRYVESALCISAQKDVVGCIEWLYE